MYWKKRPGRSRGLYVIDSRIAVSLGGQGVEGILVKHVLGGSRCDECEMGKEE